MKNNKDVSMGTMVPREFCTSCNPKALNEIRDEIDNEILETFTVWSGPPSTNGSDLEEVLIKAGVAMGIPPSYVIPKSSLMRHYWSIKSDGSYEVGKYSDEEYAEIVKQEAEIKYAQKFHGTKNPPQLYNVLTIVDGNPSVTAQVKSSSVEEALEEAKDRFGPVVWVEVVKHPIVNPSIGIINRRGLIK